VVSPNAGLSATPLFAASDQNLSFAASI